jgi:hypothetical protein
MLNTMAAHPSPTSATAPNGCDDARPGVADAVVLAEAA